MIPELPPAFLRCPLAHRALHDVTDGRPENSRAAIRAAIEAGYGIEIDLQLTGDGQAMVFHDYGLKRLTGADGAEPYQLTVFVLHCKSTVTHVDAIDLNVSCDSRNLEMPPMQDVSVQSFWTD